MLPAICNDFAFEGLPIRLVRNGELWFVLADVCQALELTNPTETARRLDEDELSTTEVTDTSGRQQEMLIVSEPYCGCFKCQYIWHYYLSTRARWFYLGALADGVSGRRAPQD